MVKHKSHYQPSWDDFAKVFYLIKLYVSIETKTCDEADLAKVYRCASSSDVYYDDPAGFIRFEYFPKFMESINCVSGRHEVGRDSIFIYYWDYEDSDRFFGEMVDDQGLLRTYQEIARIMSKKPIKS